MMLASIWIYIFGALAPFWIDEFDITRTELGGLTMVLYIVGAFGSLVAGRVVDSLEGRRLLIGTFLMAGIATLGITLAQTMPLIYAATVLAGVAMSAGNPTTNKLVARLLPPGRQGDVMGLKQAGVQAGALFGGILPALSLVIGWRWAVASSLLLLQGVGLVATLRLLPHDRPGAKEERSGMRGIREKMSPLVTYAFLMGAGVAIISTYFVLFAYESVDVSVATAGAMMVLIGMTSFIARIAWGRFGERFRHISAPLLLIAAVSLASTILVSIAESTGQSWWLWPAALGFGLSVMAWNVVGMLAIVTEIEARDVGVASGIVQSGFYGGFILTPIAFGFSVDRSASYAWGWLGVIGVFLIAVLITWKWRKTIGHEVSPMPGAQS
jgi:predicted MFS family arabinose efflux permease